MAPRAANNATRRLVLPRRPRSCCAPILKDSYDAILSSPIAPPPDLGSHCVLRHVSASQALDVGTWGVMAIGMGLCDRPRHLGPSTVLRLSIFYRVSPFLFPPAEVWKHLPHQLPGLHRESSTIIGIYQRHRLIISVVRHPHRTLFVKGLALRQYVAGFLRRLLPRHLARLVKRP